MNVITDDKINNGLKTSVTQILNILPEFTDKFPKAYSEGNFYSATDNVDWTTGFCGDLFRCLREDIQTKNGRRSLSLRLPRAQTPKVRNSGAHSAIKTRSSLKYFIRRGETNIITRVDARKKQGWETTD